MQMAPQSRVRKAAPPAVNWLNLTSALSTCELSISSTGDDRTLPPPLNTPLPPATHTSPQSPGRRIAWRWPPRVVPPPRCSLAFECWGTRRLCRGGLAGCSCNFQGENRRGNKMNSLHKRPGMKSGRLKELVLVNTKTLYDSMKSVPSIV